MADPPREVLAEGGGVLGGKVDLVGHSVEAEGDCLRRGLLLIEILEVADRCLPGHGCRVCSVLAVEFDRRA